MINAPMIAVTGSVNAPAVIGSSAVTAPLIAVSATVYAPEIRRDAKVIAPSITGTATAYVPNVQAINFSPSGMTKNGNWVPTANGAWLVVPAWTADSGSTVSGDGVQARGAKANAVVSGQLSITLSTGAYQVSVRLKVDGVVVKTITDYPLTGYATTNVPIASDPMAITTGQVATIECWFTNFSNSFPIQSGANTYVRIT